jgi:hypothetical protein
LPLAHAVGIERPFWYNNNTAKSLRDFAGPLSRLFISPWGARDCSGNPAGFAWGKSEELERKARFFAQRKMRHESSKKVNVFARAATAAPP